jgi:hypothetical protein
MSQETDAPTLVERIVALRAECERRLAVCEAQDIDIDFRDVGFPVEDDILALEAQRTERPQELRAIIGVLDFAAVLHRDRESCARDAAEQTVEIVEQALGVGEG